MLMALIIFDKPRKIEYTIGACNSVTVNDISMIYKRETMYECLIRIIHNILGVFDE